MADYDQRHRGGRNNFNSNRKRRYRDEEDYDRRPQRRRHEEPLSARIRKQLLSVAESPVKRVEDEIISIAKTICDNVEDEELKTGFLDLIIQLVMEQPFKIPFIAAVVMFTDTMQRELVTEVLEKSVSRLNEYIQKGNWREVKLLMKFLGSLQGILEGEGIWIILQDFLTKAVDLQTENNEDIIGPEMVKIILYTIPYIMSSSAKDNHERASNMIENTDIIASEVHVLQPLVEQYPGDEGIETTSTTSILSLLQKQLRAEASDGWELACLPRPWKILLEVEASSDTNPVEKHPLPAIIIPEIVRAGPRPLFPELYFSVYANQDVETVPPTTDIASCLLRDAIVDTINILDYNRNAAAQFLIGIDCYFSPSTFVKRATPFDRLRDVEGDKSTWKPEDVVVDAVFSQLFQLPFPEHKLVYYHSVLTEACKIAPAAIAPSLGRAIRFLYRSVDFMDLELSYRFLDWFAHHLSNFGFTWKWTEWIDDVELPALEPKKAFIEGALDKEIRLSFAQRIKGTLPAPYQQLITEAKEKDTPEFNRLQFHSLIMALDTPFASEGQEILALLHKKSPEESIQPIIEKIHSRAVGMNVPDPLVQSTDVYMTAICYIGSKSLSHVLSCIERCKKRLMALGPASPAARIQIIESVMNYWKDQPGIGVNIVDKLLNYTILSPESVVEWALAHDRTRLAKAYIFEMVSATIAKVMGRLRQVYRAKSVSGLIPEQMNILLKTVESERASMKNLFDLKEKYLLNWINQSNCVQNGTKKEEDILTNQWATRWLRVFKRKLAVEDAWCMEFEQEKRLLNPEVESTS
ncbi:Nuclear cap-binding protein subunit 1 [Golovinomyces cichoracearum]|uniref:Nuclear cap-binding protein subunit 1 n=1 Tax=Golovinomyces cichoracearum TaxID=62708 RepID=A0A420HVN2_9PEZI|nr:Nuclear cap-binding protein subunit 1 [Golovinomyces cichoracearum]